MTWVVISLFVMKEFSAVNSWKSSSGLQTQSKHQCERLKHNGDTCFDVRERCVSLFLRQRLTSAPGSSVKPQCFILQRCGHVTTGVLEHSPQC